MSLHTVILIKLALQAVFFLALAGCTTTVLISWVKLLRDAFSSDDDEAAPDAQQTARRPGAEPSSSSK